MPGESGAQRCDGADLRLLTEMGRPEANSGSDRARIPLQNDRRRVLHSCRYEKP